MTSGEISEPSTNRRTQACGRKDAAVRLEQARAFLDVAQLIGDQDDELATPNVTASLAVLAGIAAADAVCCAALGQRSRSQDHRQAVDMLGLVSGVGDTLARELSRLLATKDDTHYGILQVSGQRLAATLRRARNLVETAEEYLAGT